VRARGRSQKHASGIECLFSTPAQTDFSRKPSTEASILTFYLRFLPVRVRAEALLKRSGYYPLLLKKIPAKT
jgi:hypothetical protein